jgi:phosphate-selective porin OprO/OprP
MGRRPILTLLLLALAVIPASAQTAGAKSPPPKVRVRWTNHPRIDIGDLRLDFRARVTADVRNSEAAFDEDELDRTVDIARRRFGVEGQYGNLFDFQIERELGTELADAWRDVYVNYRQFEFANFRYGKFKLPFSLDENTSSINLDFTYRSLIATHLAPGRDIGWMAHGRVLDRHLGYEFGVFDQDGDNARTRNLARVSGGTTVAWRVSAQPLRSVQSPYADVYVAFARTSSDVPEGFPALQGDAVLGARMFEADFWVLGARERTGLEFRWRPGPASVKFESIRLTNERLGQGPEENDLSLYETKGWYLSGTYAITGESKADGLTDPRKPLFQGGVGAIELAARVERITFGTTATVDDVSTSPRADNYQGNSNRVVTLGVNWYLNHWVKVQYNFIKESLTDPEQGPLPTQPSYSSQVFRFQFQF